MNNLAISEIEERIKELNERYKEQEEEKNDLEYRLNIIEVDLDMLEEGLNYYYNKRDEILYANMPEKLLIAYDRPNLQGQFERNNKWYICNGYLLVESNKKFDTLDVVEGSDALSIENVLKDKNIVIINQDLGITKDLEERECDGVQSGYQYYEIGGKYRFQKKYVDAVLKLIGRENIEEISVFDNSNQLRTNGILYIKSKNMRAVILGLANVK